MAPRPLSSFKTRSLHLSRETCMKKKGERKSYSGWSGGWLSYGLRQRADWRDVLNSLDLTEKQRKAAIAVLEIVRHEGQADPNQALSHDPRSAK